MNLKEKLLKLGTDDEILRHGFAPYMRDYDVIVEVYGDALPRGVYLFRFKYCFRACCTTTLPDETLRESWDDINLNVDAWNRSGTASGFVWGAGSSSLDDVEPGWNYVEGSEIAREYSLRLGKEMHEVRLGTNVYLLRLVCHDLEVRRLTASEAAADESPRADV
jgi:hypothetical protein